MVFKWRQADCWRRSAMLISIAVVFCCAPLRLVAATPAVDATASLPMIGEWVKAVGGEHVRVRVIAPMGADPHTFEPSVRSIQAINRGHVLFIIGLGLEPWADRLTAVEPSLKIVPIAPTKGLRQISHHHGHTHAHATTHTHSHADSNHSHADGEICTEHEHAKKNDEHSSTLADAGHSHCAHGEFDPHVWLDPLRVKEMVQVIAQTLSTLAPQHAGDFKHNADAYCAQLDALDAEIRTLFTRIDEDQRKLVTNHDNLYYFAERYGFVVMDTLFSAQGVSGGQPSARRVREIVANIEANEIVALFADASSSRNLLEAVALEADLPPPGNFYSIPAGANSPAPDYLEMMRYNANEITRTLTVAANR